MFCPSLNPAGSSCSLFSRPQDMAWWFRVSLWTSVAALLWHAAAQPPYYSLQQQPLTFDQAAAACSPGLLTSLATTQELDRVLALISGSASPPVQADFVFWVGLRKAKNECMVPVLPLRGFKWTADGSEETQVSRWAEEPQHTCTTVRCAGLKARVQGPAVAEWGLVPASCKTRNPSICQQQEPQTQRPPTPTVPHLDPTSAQPEPRNQTRTSPTSGPLIPGTPDSGTGSNHPPDSQSGSRQDGGSGSCRRPGPSGTRSFILDPKDPGRIEVECWSGTVLVEVRCSGQPLLWRLLDGSVANFSSICVPCEDGFRKTPLGTCEDVDECQTGAPCRSGCINTPGSYRCVCTDRNGDVLDEDASTCEDTAGGVTAGLLVPVLVAVGALLVLLVLVAVTIKCCLMRRSKRRAEKKAEKMSMDSRDEDKRAA